MNVCVCVCVCVQVFGWLIVLLGVCAAGELRAVVLYVFFHAPAFCVSFLDFLWGCDGSPIATHHHDAWHVCSTKKRRSWHHWWRLPCCVRGAGAKPLRTRITKSTTSDDEELL